ncbi:6-carboxytetrahydropterin synthase QueD [Desulfoluna spongiiphila]|uniref:6-carboxytetrahydropterin synthase QueD n=1 Tax=Desulfoluna spongiiphila TaxID=419481 RepID=UPI00125AC0B8|nr:6-carboxytetrahydropterin synthase QueD [Desulfoluna spongiiphila]VVS93282.1 6-pyruvoyl tetrahydropterin synthase/qued family [Desulfoluna spongiiphila]
MFELKVTTRFAAAHRLTMVGKQCENLHGHNWHVEVYVQGENLDKGGVLMDFGIVKKELKKVIDTLDHTYLNESEIFKDVPASSEHIAMYIAKELERRIDVDGVKVSRVSAWESENSCATYIAD